MDIRDFNELVWTNFINGTTTTQVVLNSAGNHRLDKQAIILPAQFLNETLTTSAWSITGPLTSREHSCPE